MPPWAARRGCCTVGVMTETKLRTIVKALGWQLTGLAVTALVGLAFTGSLTAASALSLTLAAIGTVTYVLYERLWLTVTWGLERRPVAQPSTNSSRR